MRWLRLALSRLSNPNAAAAELSFHFRIAPSDRGAVASIRGELSQALAELGAESISYNCAVATDPACVNPDLGEIAGFATLGGHDASFCGEHAEQGGEALADTLLHEVMHAKAPGIPDGPYRHWADYPGSDPMNNADAYTSFVTTIARGIHGEARAPLKAESGLVVVFGQARMLGVAEETVEETVDGFAQNEFAIPPENVVQLDALLDRWQREFANVPVTLRTAGHTDGSTSSEQTAALSERRARAVTDYLLGQMAARMIPFPVHVDVRGFGSARPFIEPGRDRSGRLLSESLNRRVEIEIRPHRQ